jgi:glycosyltransferase involved in cell wall biosynthesis
MKILMASEDVPNPHLGGLGKHALNLAHALAARGHEVDFLGNAEHGVETHPEQRGPGRFIAAFSDPRGWKQQALGVYHPLALSLNTRAIRHAILRHAPGYDLVHYHGHCPWVAASLPRDLPFVQTRHDQGGDCRLNTRYKPGVGVCESRDPAACAACATTAPNALQTMVSSLTVRRMRRDTEQAYARHPTIFVSRFLRTNFERVAQQPVNGVVIHNAVDVAQLERACAQARSLRAAPEEEGVLRLFSAGALFGYKGFGPMLAALSRAAQANPRRCKLVIAGSGPEEAGLRADYASETVEFLGWSAYADVVARILQCDAVLVPSVCEEPCATSVLEALALGKTVLALRGGGTPEMLAYASSAGGRLELHDTMDELATAALAHRAARPQPPIRSALFSGSMEAMAAQVEEQYRQLLARRAGA